MRMIYLLIASVVWMLMGVIGRAEHWFFVAMAGSHLFAMFGGWAIGVWDELERKEKQ